MNHHAKLVIHGLPTMKKKELRRFEDWLGGRLLQVQCLIEKMEDRKEYDKLFTARREEREKQDLEIAGKVIEIMKEAEKYPWVLSKPADVLWEGLNSLGKFFLNQKLK